MHHPVGDAIASLVNASSAVLSGATLTFYSLADVLQDVYTNTDWVTPASTSGVLTANSSGRFPLAFFKDTLDYKAILKDSAGSTIATINPIYKAAAYLTSASAASTYLPLAGGTLTGAINFAEGAAVASASTINLTTATGNFVHVTGTTTITGVTLAQGAMRWVVFDGALILTHSSNLILPYSSNITTVANDMALFVGEGSGVTRLIGYMCNDGVPLIENVEWLMAASDETTNLTTGTAKTTMRAPFAFTIPSTSLPFASLTTVQSGGSIFTVDININGATMLSTKLTIDNNEYLSATAATPCVISGAPISVTIHDEFTVDIDQVGTAGAKGLKICVRGYRKNRP